MARQIEVENNKNIICDTREKDIVELLKRLDYREIAVQNLYDSNILDIIMIKEMGPMRFELTTSGLLKP